MAQSWSEETVQVAGADLAMIKGGSGKPLLMLHDELGFPGWMTWNETLAHDRTLVSPLQPGYGKSPKQAWIRNYRDLGGFYSQAIRELLLADPGVYRQLEESGARLGHGLAEALRFAGQPGHQGLHPDSDRTPDRF